MSWRLNKKVSKFTNKPQEPCSKESQRRHRSLRRHNTREFSCGRTSISLHPFNSFFVFSSLSVSRLVDEHKTKYVSQFYLVSDKNLPLQET